MKKEKNLKYKGIKVFLLDVSGRQAVPIAKGFAELGCEVTAYGHSKLNPGYLTKYTTHNILFDRDNPDNENFYEYAAHKIRDNKYDIVIPLRDKAAIYLSKNKRELEQYAHIAVNYWEIMQYASDKALTMEACEELGIPAPRTVSGDNILEQVDAKGLQFPLVVKPRTAGGSVGFSIIKSRESLEAYVNSYDNRNGPILCQEYIEQGDAPQYRADFFRDRDGNFKAAIVGKNTRWYPLDGGFGIFAVTLHDDEIIKNGKKLLDRIGWNGYANIDMVWDSRENKAKIIEINGRTGATILLDYVADINMSQLILENEMGYPVTDMLDYEDNCRTSCFFIDILWFLKSKNRFKADPSWFDRRGAKDAIFQWSDPKPGFGYLIQGLQNIKKGNARRKRFEP